MRRLSILKAALLAYSPKTAAADKVLRGLALSGIAADETDSIRPRLQALVQ